MVSNSEIIIIIKSTIDIRSDGHFTSIIIKKNNKYNENIHIDNQKQLFNCFSLKTFKRWIVHYLNIMNKIKIFSTTKRQANNNNRFR